MPMYFLIAIWGHEKQALRRNQVLSVHVLRWALHAARRDRAIRFQRNAKRSTMTRCLGPFYPCAWLCY